MHEVLNRCDESCDLSLGGRRGELRASHRFLRNFDLTLGSQGPQIAMSKASHSADQSTPRKKAVRLVDIAKQAGVSVSVVGSVLNGGRGNSRVAEATADKIIAIAKELNYRASPTAQQLRGKRSRVFGLLVA